MRQKLLSTLLMLTLLGIYPLSALATQPPPPKSGGPDVRIGLAHTTQAEVALNGPFLVVSDAVRAEAGTPKEVPEQVWPTVDGRIVAEIAPDSMTGIRVTMPGRAPMTASQWDFINTGGGHFQYGGVRYRGSLRLIRIGEELVVINVISIEEYLAGVVPREMPTSWPQEALRAQAVVARTYAYANMGRYAAYGYDLTNDTRSQVYGGMDAERAASTEAVVTTRGQVLMYQGKPAQTYFSASNGGKVSSPTEVWGGSYPYLRSMDDPYDADASIYMGWTQTLTEEDLKPYLPAGASLLDVRITERGPSGRATRLELVTDRGTVVFTNDSIRIPLSSRSTLIDVAVQRYGGESGLTAVGSGGKVVQVQPNPTILGAGNTFAEASAGVTIMGALRRMVSAVFEKPEIKVVVTGNGWGHGVGLSQYGARGRAEAGHTYQEILEFYFPGTTLEHLW